MTKRSHVWLVCCGLGCALGQGAEVQGKVEARRGLQTLDAAGDAPAGATRVVVRLALGEGEALREEVPVRDGRWHLVHRCSPRLAPTAYALSVSSAEGQAWASTELRVGTAADEAVARQQEREFLRGATQEVASLHGSLEDRCWLTVDAAGEEGVALGEDVAALAEGAKRATLASGTGLRMFDLRVAQPFQPQVRALLGELLGLLRARADAWIAYAERAPEDGSAPQEPPPPQDAKVEQLARQLAAELELPPDELAARFARGPLGHAETPAPEDGGTWTSVLGFSLELPAGSRAILGPERRFAPDTRLMATVPGASGGSAYKLLVRVSPLPFAVQSFDDFVEYVEVENWEREGLFTGYRRLVAAPDPEHGALRLRFTGHLRDAQTAEGDAVAGQQIALYDAEGRRALIGYLFGAGADPALLETLKWEGE
ncbi:MAG: hypothetical protein KDD82_01855 [Planctomycetes bacterium]|nr:hypothetical protein [Planctomycetota bacterium]